MAAKDLVRSVREHEVSSRSLRNGGFTVLKVVLLASGVTAVRDDRGRLTAYFDHGLCAIKPGAPVEDESNLIDGFPEGVGYIDLGEAAWSDWAEIVDTAKQSLVGVGGTEIVWHAQPIDLPYRTCGGSSNVGGSTTVPEMLRIIFGRAQKQL